MIVLICENVPSALRGELTRWLIEPKAGVFVGRVSAIVRDKLWEKVCSNVRDGGSLLIHTSSNEQGFTIRQWGDTKRWIENFDGLQLIRIPF